jgi:hypothetical protein
VVRSQKKWFDHRKSGKDHGKSGQITEKVVRSQKKWLGRKLAFDFISHGRSGGEPSGLTEIAGRSAAAFCRAFPR